MITIDQFPFKNKPFDHQMKTLKETASKLSWAWFMEMGTGKSKLTIDNFCWLYLNGEIDTVIIMAKKGEYANWVYDQLPSHVPDEIKTEVYLFSTTYFKSSAGQKAFESFLKVDKSRLRIIVVNVEALITDGAKKALTALHKTNPIVFFALDESTCAKNIDSKRSKEVYFWSSKAKYRRIMTGSPVTQSPLDLWGQSMVLGRGLLGHGSFFSFRGEYATMETMYLGQRAIKKVTGYRNLGKLNQVVKSFSTQILKSECLDLPPKIYSKRVIPMTPEQQKLYDTLRDEAMLEFENGESMEVTHVLTLLTKLHQIACGQLKLSDTQYTSIPNNRVETLLEILEDYPKKAIIWANYRQTLLDVVNALKKEYGDEAVVAYYGGVSDEDRRTAVNDFQNPDSPVRFFVANPQSAGFGLTLTQAKLSVYYSNSYNLEHRVQSEDRNHRIGQDESVTYIDFVSPNTVDEKILKALRDKKNLAAEVMGNRDYWKSII